MSSGAASSSEATTGRPCSVCPASPGLTPVTSNPRADQEREHVVARPLRLVRRAHHRDAPRAGQDVCDLVRHAIA